MKFIDEKGKLFGIINIIDLCVLLIIITFISFAVYKKTSAVPPMPASTETIQIKVEVTDVRDVTVDAITEGEIVYNYDKGEVFGKILEKTVTPVKALYQNQEGKLVESIVPNQYDVTITLESTATVTNAKILIGNEEVAIGTTVKMKGKKFLTQGTVLGLTFSDE